MYDLQNRKRGTEEAEFGYTAFNRLGGLKRRLSYGLAAALFAGAACIPAFGRVGPNTPTPDPYQSNTPSMTASPSTSQKPLNLSCADVPNIPYTVERVSVPPYSVRVVIPVDVDNKVTTCTYDGIQIEGDYPFITWTVNAIESTIKKHPEDYKIVRDNVKHIRSDEYPTRQNQSGFANSSVERLVLVANIGAYSVDKVSNPNYYLVRYTGRLLHEAEQIRMQSFEGISDIKTLVKRSNEREIAYLLKWSGDMPIINQRIESVENETERCEKGLIPACK